MTTPELPAFIQGAYEGPTPFDNVYTRIVDAMIEVDRIGYVADPRATLRRCQRQAGAALAIVQQRAFEVIERMDRNQALIDWAAWVHDRGRLECDVLGLPGGPYVTEEDLTDDDFNSHG